MAATLTLTSSTPYGLKYHYDYNGSGGGGSALASRTQAQMVADLDGVQGPNPLQAFIAGLPNGAGFGNAPKGPTISLYTTPEASVSALGAAFVVSSLSLVVLGVDGTAQTGVVEIRYNHTIDR